MSATPVALQIYENFSNKRSFELLFLQIYYFSFNGCYFYE